MWLLTRPLLSSLLLLASAATLSLAHQVDTELEIETLKAAPCERKTQKGDTISVNYLGTLAFDGTKFDSSYDYGKPFTFTLGASQVIEGWDKGLLDMCVGDKRKLTIPPNMAYGDRTVGPIPGGSTLVFETELMGIEGVQPYDPAKAQASSSSPPTPTQTEIAATTAAQAAQGSTVSPSAVANGSPTDEEDDGQCHLLGPFALVVQALLGVLALLSLVWKRYREVPRRAVKVWFFDVSKQVFGSVLLHIANVFMSMLSSGTFDVKSTPVQSNGAEKTSPNPCSFYLLNLAIDTTLGIPILVLLLRVLHALFLRTPLANPPQSIRSGNYGSPPRWTWWFKQSIIYFIGLFGMKLCVFFLFQILPWIAWVGDWALRWTEGNQKVQIAFVMFIFPVIMNAIQYYIIDSFIKERPGAEDDDRGQHRPLAQHDEDSDDEEDDRRQRQDRSFAVGDEDEDDETAADEHLKEANPTAVPAYDGERGSSSDGAQVGYDRSRRAKA